MHVNALRADDGALQLAHGAPAVAADLVDRDAAVAGVGDQQPAVGVEHDVVRLAHLAAGEHAQLLEALRVQHHDPVLAVVRDVELRPVRRQHDVVRLAQGLGARGLEGEREDLGCSGRGADGERQRDGGRGQRGVAFAAARHGSVTRV